MSHLFIVIAGIIAAFTLLAWLFWIWRRPSWMGFTDKTLWDWVGVMAMPTFVGIGSLVLGMVQIELGALKAEEQAFQVYLDRVSAMDLSDQNTHAVARAQTGAVLTQVSGPRAARVLNFLSDLEAIAIAAPDLEAHDLHGAELKGLDLSGLNFEDADLRQADFEGALLRGANFEGADLRGADFKGADLTDAQFSEANMRGVSLSAAVVSGEALTGALHLAEGALSNVCAPSDAVCEPQGDDGDDDDD